MPRARLPRHVRDEFVLVVLEERDVPGDRAAEAGVSDAACGDLRPGVKDAYAQAPRSREQLKYRRVILNRMRRYDRQANSIHTEIIRVQAGAGAESIQELPTSVSQTYYRSGATYAALVILVLALGRVLAGSYHVSFSGADDSCCVSEWLINYDGGFVRRGLGGALILGAASLTGLSPRAIVFAVLSSSYTLFFAALGAMVWRLRK